jgi:hypothetical protein
METVISIMLSDNTMTKKFRKEENKKEKEKVISNITEDERLCDHQVVVVNTTARAHIPSHVYKSPGIISIKSNIHKLDDANQILTKFSFVT